jgi:hypothetical protein
MTFTHFLIFSNLLVVIPDQDPPGQNVTAPIRDPDPQHWLKARLLEARRLTSGSKPAAAAAEAWPEKRDSVLEVIGGHLAKFRPLHVDYPQLDHLTDMDLRAFTAQRRVRLRERMPRKRVTNVLIFGDFALQSIDAAFLKALGKKVYIIRSAYMFKDVYSYSFHSKITFLLHSTFMVTCCMYCSVITRTYSFNNYEKREG